MHILTRLGLLSVLLLGSGKVFCCSVATTSLSSLLEEADLVMVVRIMKSSFQEDRMGENNYAPISAEYQITEVIKGNSSNIKKLISGFGNGDCGIGLAPGHYYLIISKEPIIDGELSVWLRNGSEDLGVENPITNRSLLRVRVDAIREFIHTGKPIDLCFDWVAIAPPLSGTKAKRCRKVIESAYDVIKSEGRKSQ